MGGLQDKVPIQPKSYRRFENGLIASVQELDQPEGSIPAVSNMVYTRRGALKTCDGSLLQASPAAGFTGKPGAMIDEIVFQPNNAAAQVVALLEKQGTPENTVLVTAKSGYANGDVLATVATSSIRTASTILTTSTRTPNGGVAAEVSALSQLLQFNNNLILILGNGVAPRSYPSGGPDAALLNNFVSSLPVWTANTAYQAGAIIVPTVGNAHLYRCAQAGTTGASQPTFPTTLGTIVLDGTAIWQEAGSNAVVAPRGAAHATVHAGFLWIFNTSPTTNSDYLDGPSCLGMSDLNNPNTWNPLNRAFLDIDDGQEGMGISPFAISAAGIPTQLVLVAFKNTKTFVINGVFGAPDFFITRAETDKGCIAPRTIQFVSEGKYRGIIRLTHEGFAHFDGVSDQVISDEIRPYIFNEGLSGVKFIDPSYIAYSHATQTVSPPMYVCSVPLQTSAAGDSNGQATRLLCLDLVLGGWTVIDVPFSVYGLYQRSPTSLSATLQTDLLGFTDGNIRRWQATDVTWDITGGVIWSFQTPETYGSDPTTPSYFRRCFIRGFIVSGTVTIKATVSINGTAQSQYTTKQLAMGGSRFEVEVPIGLRALSANVSVSGTGPVEIDSLEFHISQKPAGVPVSLMIG